MYTLDSKDLGTFDGFDIEAFVVYDENTRPEEFDDECYSEAVIEAWRKDEWQFVGVIVHASKRGHKLGSASLWSLERGWFPDAENSDKYLDPLAYGAGDFLDDLRDEAVSEAKTELAVLTSLVDA